MPYLNSPVVPAGTLARVPQPSLPGGDGLLLRPWQAKDAPAVYAAFQDPLMHQWHIRSADSEQEVADWIAQWQSCWTDECQAQWAVVDADTDELLGRVALRQILLDDGCAEVAYWTVARARGRGVAVRATTTLSRWAFEEIGLHRLELSCWPPSCSSARSSAPCPTRSACSCANASRSSASTPSCCCR
ncbi:GNAT family N-acetyltransferase [Streptomyces sp. NPDC059680]|uniref:GNAT family N-acetyltransferase n=1 Tax=Streptomyces sp. NPDC059680 TaxID=3346904 RepID=UPI00369E3A05